MSKALMQSVGRRLDDIARRIEIGLANFEMNNVSAFCLQRSRFHQDFERSLSAEARHPLGEAKFVGLSHDAEMSIKARWRNLSFSAHVRRITLLLSSFDLCHWRRSRNNILSHRQSTRKFFPIATSPKLAAARIIVRH
jgi:hypothetical protein